MTLSRYRGIEQEEPHHRARIVEHQPGRIVDAHYALHNGPICEEASHIAQFEDERRVQSALLDRIWTVTVGAISIKMTLIAVEVVEVIEKMIKLASHPIVAMQVLTRLGSAATVGLAFEPFSGPTCHRPDFPFADLTP